MTRGTVRQGRSPICGAAENSYGVFGLLPTVAWFAAAMQAPLARLGRCSSPLIGFRNHIARLMVEIVWLSAQPAPNHLFSNPTFLRKPSLRVRLHVHSQRENRHPNTP